jgi:hypothetical protein
MLACLGREKAADGFAALEELSALCGWDIPGPLVSSALPCMLLHNLSRLTGSFHPAEDCRTRLNHSAARPIAFFWKWNRFPSHPPVLLT